MPHTEEMIAMLEPRYEHIAASEEIVGEPLRRVIAAMCQLRDDLRALGGSHLVALADEALCDRLMIRLLQLNDTAGSYAENAPQHEIASAQFTESVMLGAADACSRSATTTPASRGIFYVLLLLLDRLVETYAQPLTAQHLLRWLQSPRNAVTGELIWPCPDQALASLSAREKSLPQSKRSRRYRAM